MKKTTFSFVVAFLVSIFVGTLSGQNIKLIAAYDNESSTTSGIYAVGDTALYRYSWYYQQWFPLSNRGLNKINDTVQISALAVYNNYSSNSSGLFVFSDSAVYNYNWITALWYSLSNNGLPRQNQKPIVKQLSVYGDEGSSSNSTVIALSDTAIFRYSWYYQAWTPLPNAGLVTSLKNIPSKQETIVRAYPNPFIETIHFDIEVPENNNGEIEISIFDINAKLMHTERISINKGINTISPKPKNLPPGMYFCEIFDGNNLKILKVIRTR